MRARNAILICVLVSLSVLPQTRALAAPKLKIGEPDFDFGYIAEGLPVVHKYWAFNVGTDTLQILKVRPSCGCTSVPLTKNRLAPGDSVALELKFKTQNFKGVVSKTAKVETNDTTQADAKLRFTANVGKWEGTIIANPAEVYLDTLGKEEQVVMIKNTSDEPYAVYVVSGPADYLAVELSTGKLVPKGEVRVAIRTSDNAPIGEFNSSVTLHLEGSKPHNLTIPIFGVGYLP